MKLERHVNQFEFAVAAIFVAMRFSFQLRFNVLLCSRANVTTIRKRLSAKSNNQRIILRPARQDAFVKRGYDCFTHFIISICGGVCVSALVCSNRASRIVYVVLQTSLSRIVQSDLQIVEHGFSVRIVVWY